SSSDIKPANIWLESRPARDGKDTTTGHTPPTVKLLDFGLARSASEDKRLTQSGMIVGTPAYMAPEQVDGVPVDARADLFSLGGVLYRMLTGKLAFDGESIMKLLGAVFNHPPRRPHEGTRGVSAELSRLTMRWLAKKPDGRPASAAVVRDEWRSFRHGADAPTLLPAPRPPRPPRRRGLLAVA